MDRRHRLRVEYINRCGLFGGRVILSGNFQLKLQDESYCSYNINLCRRKYVNLCRRKYVNLPVLKTSNVISRIALSEVFDIITFAHY